MRFRAPAREQVDPQVFEHPLFADYQAWGDCLRGVDWPELAALNPRLAGCCETAGLPPYQLLAQDADLLALGRHYERWIGEQQRIPTRTNNWHDLFNALVWMRHGWIKQAMNRRQCADIARIGDKQRSRAQCALTHFDEAGVVVVLRRQADVDAWDRHDWPRLFLALKPADYALRVIGHALLEHALQPDRLLVGKALLLVDPDPLVQIDSLMDGVSTAIAEGRCLNDPLELRPLPLMGLPGWHPLSRDPLFLSEAECFQPVRAGRHYPPALSAADLGVPGRANAQVRDTLSA